MPEASLLLSMSNVIQHYGQKSTAKAAHFYHNNGLVQTFAFL